MTPNQPVGMFICMTTSLVPNLWFDGNAHEAAEFYTSIFPNSSIGTTVHNEDGSVLVVEFSLDGHPFSGINGGPIFQFSEAVSFAIETKDQAETDRYWAALTAEGGGESQCGWLKDRFGLSWQVYPKELQSLLSDPNAARRKAAVDVMMTQVKIDIEPIRAAADAVTS